MLSTAFTFWNLNDFSDIFWMIPMMGFCQLALFGGYAIYLPELFPTRLRSTGTSFCYNVGRFVAASGPLALGLLTSRVFAGSARADALRRRDHVPGLPARAGDGAVRARDERTAAAGMSAYRIAAITDEFSTTGSRRRARAAWRLSA